MSVPVISILIRFMTIFLPFSLVSVDRSILAQHPGKIVAGMLTSC